MLDRDAEERPSLVLMLVGEGRRTLVWLDPDWGDAILAAQEWEADDMGVADTVADGAGPWGFT